MRPRAGSRGRAGRSCRSRSAWRSWPPSSAWTGSPASRRKRSNACSAASSPRLTPRGPITRRRAGVDERTPSVTYPERIAAAVVAPRRALVTRLRRIGDAILALPVLDALREAFPDCVIDFLAEEGPGQAAVGHPAVDRVLVLDRT